ncbi:MAG: hypothetical protein GXC73_06340 [Chitinophagaceae bacterium]|nr:hypothetical protein [Chitinophagaceae bacterium]
MKEENLNTGTGTSGIVRCVAIPCAFSTSIINPPLFVTPLRNTLRFPSQEGIGEPPSLQQFLMLMILIKLITI